MKTKLCLLIFLLAATIAHAQTNNLTSLLQQGLLAEQANRDLDAAISNYQSLASQFDQDRQLAATAIFRLGECCRMQGKTNEAALEYRRIIREFPDQKTLATLSQQDLAGMGISQSAIGQIAGNSTAPGAASTDAARLAGQISGIESLTNAAEEARAVLAIFPENSADLQKVLMHLPMLQEQEAWVEAHPQTSYDEFVRTRGLVYPIGGAAYVPVTELQKSHLLASARLELQSELTYIQQQVDFILGLQKARLKVLQAAAGAQTVQETAQSSAPNDAEDQEIQRIQTMLQNSPDLINALSNGNTPLGNAAAHGWLKVATFLLDHGADVNGGYGSALFSATSAGNRAMVELLLSRGANVNDNRQDTEKTTPLHIAAMNGFQAVMAVLLANKADVNAQTRSGYTPLFEAAQRSQTKIVQMLLDAGASPNIADKEGRTPLSFAAESGSPETVKALLAAKADPNAGTMDAPLLCAVDENNLGCAELLLQADANPDVDVLMHCPQGSYGSRWYNEHSTVLRSATPLWLAIQKHELPMVQLLLKYKANPDLQISEPPPVIFWALSDTNILQALLDAGANPNIKNNDGRTPLSVAAENGSLEAVKLLLAAKADPNAGTCDAPLLGAINKRDITSTELLLQAGANPNLKGNAQDFRHNGYNQATPLWMAVSMNQLPMVQLLLKFKADPNDSQIDNTPVIFSAVANTNILEALLDAGAKVDARDSTAKTRDIRILNWTPLLLSVESGLPVTTVEILLKHGANPNARDGALGGTPLHWMAGWGAQQMPNRKVLELLLDYKADPNVRNDAGQTPLDELKQWATGNNWSPEQRASLAQLADFLRQHGALDNPPNWDRIQVSGLDSAHSAAVFQRNTNGWNHFTLLEAILDYYESASGSSGWTSIDRWTQYPSNPGIPFPDLSRVAIIRPSPESTNITQIKVNLLNGTNGIDGSKDVPLEFGDTVEIPAREHTLAESDNSGPTWIAQISSCLQSRSGRVKLVVVGGQTIQVQLDQFGPLDCGISQVLDSSQAQNVLTSDSDLSRVKVVRRDAKTGKKSEWILNCASLQPPGQLPAGSPPVSFQTTTLNAAQSSQQTGNLWLRDGDVVEVPEKP